METNPIRVDEFRQEIANQVGIVIDGDVGREAEPFEKVVPCRRGELDVSPAQLLDPGKALLRAPPLGTPVIRAEDKFKAHKRGPPEVECFAEADAAAG